jgi:HPt (histidine-containing phosphotransfer) domain-containing protein
VTGASANGATSPPPARRQAIDARRVVTLLCVIFAAIFGIQLLSLRLISRASGFEHNGRLRLSVAANQRLVVEQFAQSSYLAGVALASENWPLLADQRHQAAALTARFEETNRALARGGTVAFGDELVQIVASENPDVVRLLEEANRIWTDASADQVRMLRTDKKEARENVLIDRFRVHMGELVGVLDEVNENLRLESQAARRDTERAGFFLPSAAATLLVLLAVFIYLRVLRPWQEVTNRTAALNHDMQLVLDNVGEGLLTVNRRGEASEERSALLEKWLGPVPSGTRFSDALRRHNAETAQWFDLSIDAFFEGVLPDEVSLAQFPRTLDASGRTLQFRYHPVAAEAGRPNRLLVMLDDVTESVEHQWVEAEQRELIACFQHITQDRAGFEEFLAEAEKSVDALTDRRPLDEDVEKRLLHTLKGNCGLFGLFSLSELCNELEETLLLDARRLNQEDVERLRGAWKVASYRSRSLLGSDGRDAIEIEVSEHQAALELARQTGASAALVATLAGWAHEPARKRLERCAEQARSLARRLGKPALDIHLEADDVRLDAAAWAPFWAAFAHAVRNAVDHGIESAAVRKARAKPDLGRLWFEAKVEGDVFRIALRDDGAGVSWERVARQAAALGLPAHDREALARALFHRGFSTKERPTGISGRGVGLNALKQEVETLSGTVRIQSVEGEGTLLEAQFPRSMATYTRAVASLRTHPCHPSSEIFDAIVEQSHRYRPTALGDRPLRLARGHRRAGLGHRGRPAQAPLLRVRHGGSLRQLAVLGVARLFGAGDDPDGHEARPPRPRLGARLVARADQPAHGARQEQADSLPDEPRRRRAQRVRLPHPRDQGEHRGPLLDRPRHRLPRKAEKEGGREGEGRAPGHPVRVSNRRV